MQGEAGHGVPREALRAALDGLHAATLAAEGAKRLVPAGGLARMRAACADNPNCNCAGAAAGDAHGPRDRERARDRLGAAAAGVPRAGVRGAPAA